MHTCASAPMHMCAHTCQHVHTYKYTLHHTHKYILYPPHTHTHENRKKMLGVEEYTLAREMGNRLKVYYTEVYIQDRWAHGKHVRTRAVWVWFLSSDPSSVQL